METQKTLNCQSNPEQKRILLEVSQYLTSKTTLQSHSNKNSHVSQWNQTEDAKIKPCSYIWFLIKVPKKLHWKNDSLFNKWCWENWISTCRGIKLHHFLSPCTGMSTKWIKDLNLGPETFKLLEENGKHFMIQAWVMTFWIGLQ
jgi:hypothetical protein